MDIHNTSARILIYHGIDEQGRKDLNLRFISATQLEAQLRYFKQHFNIVSLDTCFENQTADTTKKDKSTLPDLAITFDDGYANNFILAKKILEKYQIPATFFVTGIRNTAFDYHWPDALDICVRYNWRPLRFDGTWYFKMGRDYRSLTGLRLKQRLTHVQPKVIASVLAAFQYRFEHLIARKPDLDLYWQLMDLDAIRAAAASPYITIGVHGLHHYNLAVLPFAAAQEELLACKQFLEQITGQTIRSVAWPFGLYTPELARYAASIGLDRQYACDFIYPEDNTNPNMRERIGIHPFLGLEDLVGAIRRGHYG